MSRVAELPRGLPRIVLGLEEAPEFVLRDLDAELPEELPHHPWVLDLVHRAWHPEKRLIALAETRGGLGRRGQLLAAEREESGLPPRFQQNFVVGEMEERVSPVEEDGVDHRQANVRVRAAWSAKRSTRSSCSAHSWSSSTGQAWATSHSSSLRPLRSSRSRG